MVLVALGSSYYHGAPDNARLRWDRLPMAIVYMALVAAMITERIGVRAGLVLLPVFLAVGIASVIAWELSEMRGAGDLRFYAAVQIYAVLVLLVVPNAATVHGQRRFGRCGWLLCARETAGKRGPHHLRTRTRDQRTPAQTLGCCRRGLVAFTDAAEAQSGAASAGGLVPPDK